MMLNPNYVFDNYISTASNGAVREACLNFALTSPPPANPLFLHGPTSVGKTHLLYAIGNQVMAMRPDDKVILVSAEAMRNDLYDSVNLGQMEQFRDQYASVDLLLVDDMQILSRRERTQEEFARIFEELVVRGGRLALASSRPPDNLYGISDILRSSELKSSLLLPLKPPSEQDLELILSRKYAAASPPVPKRIIEMAVRQGTFTDIRRAEGMVKRMVFVESQSQ